VRRRRSLAGHCAAVAGLTLLSACTSSGGRPATLAGTATAAGSAAHAATRTPVAAPTSVSTSERWRVVYRTHQTNVLLTAVAAVSPTDAWAVGVAGAVQDQPVVLRWNGAHWRSVTLPDARDFLPDEVQATSASDVWIFGGERGGPAEAMRFDGSTWRFETMPAGNWVNSSPTVLSPASVWLVSSACTLGPSPSACKASMAHWNGSRWSVSRLPILVSGLADVSGTIWVVGAAGCHAGSGGLGSGIGRLIVFRQKGAGWESASTPEAPVRYTSCTDSPQLAVGAHGAAWILSMPPGLQGPQGGQALQATLLAWNGVRWTQGAVPARSAGHRLGVVDQLTYDGHDGVWLGPFAHWTGRRWLNVDQLEPGQAGTIYLGATAAMPGSGSSWAVGGSGAFLLARPSGPGVIAVNGPLPS
jgi:hypothetical protein